MKIYLAGPMRGILEYNFPAFEAACNLLRSKGYEVWSPHERDISDGFNPKTDTARTIKYYMHIDLPAVLECDAVVVLPGWKNSQGARMEVCVATECGMPIHEYDVIDGVGLAIIPHELPRIVVPGERAATANATSTPPPSAARVADQLVNGPRNHDYGHPYDDFSRTAKGWEMVLGIPVTPKQVALCMVALKISREVHRPKRDNLVDGIGYFLTAEKVIEREQEMAKKQT